MLLDPEKLNQGRQYSLLMHCIHYASEARNESSLFEAFTLSKPKA